MLDSAYPMAICWGRDYTLLYNDALRTMYGTKHPTALSRSFKTAITSVLRISIVEITVQPSLAGLGRFDDRMPGCARVLRGMTVRRTIAAVGAATFLTRPQVNPGAADLDAFLAEPSFRVLDGLNDFQMDAGSIRHRARFGCS
jgi:hypothetical protein